MLSDDSIAFAAAGLLACPIQNHNRAAIRFNPATILQGFQYVSHTGTSHAHFRGRADNFEFECSKKVLVIRGRVPTFYLKHLLQDALKQVDGVRRIDNRVDVVGV
jgi:hypothetical protein